MDDGGRIPRHRRRGLLRAVRLPGGRAQPARRQLAGWVMMCCLPCDLQTRWPPLRVLFPSSPSPSKLHDFQDGMHYSLAQAGLVVSHGCCTLPACLQSVATSAVCPQAQPLWHINNRVRLLPVGTNPRMASSTAFLMLRRRQGTRAGAAHGGGGLPADACHGAGTGHGGAAARGGAAGGGRDGRPDPGQVSRARCVQVHSLV